MNALFEEKFAALMQYSPRGLGTPALNSRTFCYAIKNDGLIYVTNAAGMRTAVRAIDRVPILLKARLEEAPFLKDYFGQDVLLVPMPRSAPLSKPDALWPARKICEAFVAAGLGGDVVPMVERVKMVQKSATAAPGGRPGAQDHYNSTKITARLPLSVAGAKRITLVDDVVTRGATFVGILPHIRAAFPKWELRCFAVVRTRSSGEFDKVIAPVEGTISYDSHLGSLRREP